MVAKNNFSDMLDIYSMTGWSVADVLLMQIRKRLTDLLVNE
jgi:hypothetical protein